MARRACYICAVVLGALLSSAAVRAQDQSQALDPSVVMPPMSPLTPLEPGTPAPSSVSVSGNTSESSKMSTPSNFSMPGNMSIYPEHACASCDSGAGGSCCAGSCGGGCCCQRCPEEACTCRCPGYDPCFQGWYVEADALIVTRNNASINQPVVLADDTGDTVLTTHDPDFGWNGGFRLFIGEALSKCGGWEIGYFGIYGGTASARAEDENNLDIPQPLASVAFDFDNADTMTLTWNWTVNNAEFNVFRQCGRFQGLIGFRYFNLEEKFNIHAEDSDGDASDYPIRTSNNLYGGQLGARTYCEWKCFRLGWVGKAGVFGNDALERQTVFDNNNTTILRNTQGRSTAVSFVGDLNAFATLQLSHYWRFRAGYYLLYVSNVALAPDQLDFSFLANSGTTVHDSANLFVHGATFGLEAAW